MASYELFNRNGSEFLIGFNKRTNIKFKEFLCEKTSESVKIHVCKGVQKKFKIKKN